MTRVAVTRFDGFRVMLLTHPLDDLLVEGLVIPRRKQDGWPCRTCALRGVDTLERMLLAHPCVLERGGIRVVGSTIQNAVDVSPRRPSCYCPVHLAYDFPWSVRISGACECDQIPDNVWSAFTSRHGAFVQEACIANSAALRPFVASVVLTGSKEALSLFQETTL